jgi:putative membrane protein
MSAKTFFTPAAKSSVTAAIKAIEERTSAEIVVTLRDASGHYRHADYLAGLILALAGLCFFLYYPADFRVDFFPLEAVALFALGAASSAFLPPLRRLLSARALMDRNVLTAARAAFVEQGISRTRGRTGILVFISMLERRVELVADLAIDAEALGAPWKEAVSRLQQTMRGDPELDRFVEALTALAPVLEAALPRAEDDVNELPDEVVG